MNLRLITLAAGTFAIGTDSFVVAGVLPAVARSFEVGIDTAGQLRIALDAGADHFQGDFLACMAPAGSVFDERPVPIAALLDTGGKVVSLRG